jgi:hypothetical protein
MAPTPLTPTLRYVPQSVRKIYWVVTIATQSSPTRSEINAGTDLTAEIQGMSGFSLTSGTKDTADLSTRFTSQIPGAITADKCEIICYASSTSADVRAVLPRDAVGFILALWEGDVPTQKMDVFPVKVSSTFLDTAIADPAQVHVEFVVTKLPSLNVTIPA